MSRRAPLGIAAVRRRSPGRWQFGARSRCRGRAGRTGPGTPWPGTPTASAFSRKSRLYKVFGPESQASTVSELSKRAGLPMPTVSRMISELVEHAGRVRDGDTRG
ncbi:helix-turn-helix domain-containing protein [Nocardia amikacinitolerans]|uniref:helix-turn-helix domain-containing protein n=1 Tax=Nocardia amikacinitolerans TaxID=756689 RepID=UPI000A04218A